MVHQKFRMVASCRVPRKYSCLLTDTFQGKPRRSRTSAYWVMGLPTADRFDQTTSRAASLSSAGRIVDTWELLRRGTAVPARQLCAYAGLEWAACPHTIRCSH